MADLDPEVINTTQALLDCVNEIRGPNAKGMATSAMLVYEFINENGDSRIDYVISHDMDMRDVVSMGIMVSDDAREYFRKQGLSDD